MTKIFASLLGIAALFAIVAMIPSATAAPRWQETTATARLVGTEEVPDPGDPDGTGTATVTFKPASGEICWDVKVSSLTLPSVGTHIHEGAKDTAGPVVVPFTPPDANGVASGCTKPDAALMTRIMQTPENFYVNVHTSDFPAGAVRGQIMMAAGGAGPVAEKATLPNTGLGSGTRPTFAGLGLLAVANRFSLGIGGRPRNDTR